MSVLAVMKEAAEDTVSADVGLRLLRAAEDVAELIAAAELANLASRLNTRSDHEQRAAVATTFGLDRFAPLDSIRAAADNRLTVALLTVKGDAATLAKRAANTAALARVTGGQS